MINECCELIAFKITCEKRNDAKAGESIMQKLQGLMLDDKGYIVKALFSRLLAQGLKLITHSRKNMKEKKYSLFEKQLLDKRCIIETVINHFKHHYHIWHTRHRSVLNAMTHLMAGIAAYVIEPLKLSTIKLLAANNYLAKTPN